MKVTVYGAGYVGLVTSVCLAEIGHHVLCTDVATEKIVQLQQCIPPIHEEGLEQLIQRNTQTNRLQFTVSVEEAVTHGDIQLIAVGTPQCEDGSVNLEYVDAVAHAIGKLRIKPCIVANKSTVPPGTADRVHELIAKTAAKYKRVNPAHVVSNPEFLQEGIAVQQCLNPDRILIGTTSPTAIAAMKELYGPLLHAETKSQFIVMSTRAAELAKYAANSLLATKISFINELSEIAESVGVDIAEVKRGIVADYRINEAFLNEGCGFGGSCFPKDLAGLEKIAQEHQCSPFLISAVIARNKRQQQLVFKKLNTYFNGELQKKIIAVWGLSFKPGTDDVRCASSHVLIDALLQVGARIQAYDPLAMQATAEYYKKDLSKLHFAESALGALEQADALAVVTEWPQFKNISLSAIYSVLKHPVIIDGRNIFDPDEAIEAGFYYSGVGRVRNQ